ncbi:TetR/AcrR family transcriptional regulator [Streptomyces sp. NPDC051963]|uniref:TetR/AcrR family transcriptional regulator n=1 Tax=Streptomyces sp. NPDC051963 TaxID=3365678 RepID=UPI0037D40278
MNTQGLPTDRLPEADPARGGRARRTRGQSAGLDPARIVAAARSLEPGAITMQAVADVLGVDRSAINNHVANKDALLRDVALDVFAEAFATVRIGAGLSWQDVCRQYARGFADSVIATGPLAQHLVSGAPFQGTVLHAAEVMLGAMTDGGIDSDTAIRMLALLNNVCLQYAHDHIAASARKQGPLLTALRQALAERDADDFPHLARIAAHLPDVSARTQLDVSVEIIIGGTETLAGERTTHATR